MHTSFRQEGEKGMTRKTNRQRFTTWEDSATMVHFSIPTKSCSIPACVPFVVHILPPLMMRSSPSSTALVLMLATSDPAPTSDTPKHATRSPDTGSRKGWQIRVEWRLSSWEWLPFKQRSHQQLHWFMGNNKRQRGIRESCQKLTPRTYRIYWQIKSINQAMNQTIFFLFNFL